jgi:hypothetical protein
MDDFMKRIDNALLLRRLLAEPAPTKPRSIASALPLRGLTPPPPLSPPITAAEIGNMLLMGVAPPAPPNLLVNPYRARLTPPPRTYTLFLSHDWEYSVEYNGLVALLRKPEIGLDWDNLSIPRTDPVAPNPKLPRSDRTLALELERRMDRSDCLLVLAGVYCTYSRWIQWEIEAAQERGIPIVAVTPHQRARLSGVVRNAATEVVYWRAQSIAEAVRRFVR